jgi:signal recognition particle subunit SRP68
LHTTIYTLIMNGRFLRYRDDFEDALIQLCVARGLLTELASRATTSRDQALATLFSDEIGPEIRHCAHELGRSKAYDVDNIVAELAAKHRNEIVEGCDALLKKLEQEGQAAGNAETRKRLQTLMWEDQPVPVRNPELVDVLLRVQDAEARLAGGSGSQTHAVKGTPRRGLGASSKKSVAAYDAILLALSDAEEVARKLAEAQQVRSHFHPYPAGWLMRNFRSRAAAALLHGPMRGTFTSCMHTSSTNYFPAASNVISS